MSSNASYIVIKNGNTSSYESRYGGSNLINTLFCGPDYATDDFESEGKNENLAENCFGEEDEATALVDWDQRILIWTSQYCELPVQQRLYNKLLAELWEGWTIRWAVCGIEDILEYAGFQADVPRVDCSEDDNDDDEPIDVEHQLKRVDLSEPQRVEVPVAYDEGLQPGCWLSIRDTDGSYRDYFGWDNRSFVDSLNAGEAIVGHLSKLPTCQSLPSELLTTEGGIIDPGNRVIWRWKGSRYPLREREFVKAWKGWTVKQIEGGWREQMQLTGRETSELAGDERHILGWTLSSLIDLSQIEPQKKILKVVKVVRGLRIGCVVATVALAIVAGSLAYWMDSITTGVILGLLFILSASLTRWIWKKTKFLSTKLTHGMTIEEKAESINGALTRLGYPSIEQLQESGEFPRVEDAD